LVEIFIFIVGAAPTMIVAVAVAMPVDAAEIVALPEATPVTGTVVESCPAGIVAVAATVAKLVLLLDKLNVIPLGCGAGAEIAREILPVRVAGRESEAGLNAAVTVTCTVPVSGANPAAEAVITVDPIATPVTCGFAAGTCWPCGTKTLGVIVATAEFPLLKLMVIPPVGASEDRLTARLPDCPGATVTVPL
jgi:hypothetical protein